MSTPLVPIYLGTSTMYLTVSTFYIDVQNKYWGDHFSRPCVLVVIVGHKANVVWNAPCDVVSPLPTRGPRSNTECTTRYIVSRYGNLLIILSPIKPRFVSPKTFKSWALISLLRKGYHPKVPKSQNRLLSDTVYGAEGRI